MPSEQSEPHTHRDVEYVKVGFYTGPPGKTKPFEQTTVTVKEKDWYAVDGGTVDCETYIHEAISRHLNGECKCVSDRPKSQED